MSPKVPPTDLELTVLAGTPEREKNGEKIWGMVLKNCWYPKTAPKPFLYKTFDRITSPFTLLLKLDLDVVFRNDFQ